MKIIAKNTTEILNEMYGDEEDYDYITDEDMDCLIDDKIKTLEEVYDYMEEHPRDFKGDAYDIGDVINLISLFKRIRCYEDKESDVVGFDKGKELERLYE